MQKRVCDIRNTDKFKRSPFYRFVDEGAAEITEIIPNRNVGRKKGMENFLRIVKNQPCKLLQTSFSC